MRCVEYGVEMRPASHCSVRLMGGWSSVGMGGVAQRRSHWESHTGAKTWGCSGEPGADGSGRGKHALNPMPVCPANLRESKDRYSKRKPGVFHYR